MLVVMLVPFVPAVIAVMFHVDRAHSPGTKRVFLLATYDIRILGVLCIVTYCCPSLGAHLSRSPALQILD